MPGNCYCIICFKLGTKWNREKSGLGGRKYTLFVGRMRIVLWAREKCSESSSRRPVSHCDYYKILARHNHNNKRDLNTKQKKRARAGDWEAGSGRKSVKLLSRNYC